ncbi:MAG TPA: class I SAM-dependent methyltransferase [Pirellulaceae bacterium]|nr:class I SAM-dependent methyltransferase [Pirellulaceae bacterium]
MQREQYDLLAHLEDTHWWFVARRQILAAMVEELALPPRSVIVDIGCGAGGNLAQFAADNECVGIDASEEALSHARRRFPQVSFLRAERPPDAPEVIQRANLLMLNDVLEHVEYDRELLSSIVSLASPGAHLLITVPADMSLWGPHDVSHGHFRRYTPDQLAQLWEGLPVETRLVSHFNTRLYPVIRAIRTLGRWRNRSFGSSNTDLRPAPRPINAMLTKLFAGEAARLRRALRGNASAAYRYGVSLLAILRVADDAAPARSTP